MNWDSIITKPWRVNFRWSERQSWFSRLLKSVSISNNFTAVDPSVLKFLIHLHPAPHPSSHLLLILHATSRGLWGKSTQFVGEIHPSIRDGEIKIKYLDLILFRLQTCTVGKGELFGFSRWLEAPSLQWRRSTTRTSRPDLADQRRPMFVPKRRPPTWTMSSLLLSKNTLLATLLQNVMNHDHCHHLDLWKSSKDRGWGYVSSLVPQRNIF